jgi:hypothetical protein
MSTLWDWHPLLVLYAVYLVALVVAFFWPGNAAGPVRDDQRRPPDDGQESVRPPRTAGHREPAAVRPVETVCSTESAARFSAASRRVPAAR